MNLGKDERGDRSLQRGPKQLELLAERQHGGMAERSFSKKEILLNCVCNQPG
jgi:hypothetical protein